MYEEHETVPGHGGRGRQADSASQPRRNNIMNCGVLSKYKDTGGPPNEIRFTVNAITDSLGYSGNTRGRGIQWPIHGQY